MINQSNHQIKHSGIIVQMKFFEELLSRKTKDLRQEVIGHEFWKKIENGTLDKKYLKKFILQDFWLVKQALKIDTLIIASMKTQEIVDLLLQRLPKKLSFTLLYDFGKGVGLTKDDFQNVDPIPGCMALTTFFFWMIGNSSDLEKIAAIDASKEVFSLLCVKVKPALKKYYNLSEEETAFFTAHKDMEEKLSPVDRYIEKQFKNPKTRKIVENAIQLSYGHEILFYDSILG